MVFARAVLVPCLSRPDVTAFAPGDSADPRYGELFRQATQRTPNISYGPSRARGVGGQGNLGQSEGI